MKRGDIVRFRRATIEAWSRNERSQERINYFSGELKIENSDGRWLTFSYPPGGCDGSTGLWGGVSDDFEMVRVAEPEKCKWKRCGKTHNEKGLCIT